MVWQFIGPHWFPICKLLTTSLASLVPTKLVPVSVFTVPKLTDKCNLVAKKPAEKFHTKYVSLLLWIVGKDTAQNKSFSCCQAKTILTHEPVYAPRKKKIPKRRSLCNCLETCHLQSYFRHFSEDPPNKFHPKFAFSKTIAKSCFLYYLCTVNQWKCSGSLVGGIYYDQGRSQ